MRQLPHNTWMPPRRGIANRYTEKDNYFEGYMTIAQIKAAMMARIYELPLPFSVTKTLENQEYGFTALPSGELVRNPQAQYGPTEYREIFRLEDLELWELAILLEAQEATVALS